MKNLVLLLALSCALPAQAINKCTGSDGKTTFQDAPCAGKGQVIETKPASGLVQSKTPSPVAPGQQQTEAQRIEKMIAASQTERRKNELEQHLVPAATNAISAQRLACDQELKSLQAKKLQANNNLAGAVWEGSISSEMNAVSSRCTSNSADLRLTSETLRKECQALGGCK